MNENWMIADLHIHSRFSRACSKDLNFDNLVKWARIKGIHLLGTGDFTHPIWFKEMKEKLIEKNGLYYYNDFPFIISGEISLIYTQERGRRVHLVILVPNLVVADKINSYLDSKGRRDYDGRPIFKISCRDFVKDMMEISKDIEIIPAHIWTPYFGVLGSQSGFESLAEAFGDQIENVHAIETGISSNPDMNAKIFELKDKSVISFSDSHSFWPFRLGREATIFNKVDSYQEIIGQIRDKSFIATVETDPAYGKYHWDGHRNCKFSCSPEKTKELNGICPICKGKLTLGVDYRVEQLTNTDKIEPKKYYPLLPLHEIIALFMGVGMQSKKVWDIYNSLIEKFGNEFEILLNMPRERFIAEDINPKLIGLILKNRNGNIKVKPGYDGEYGVAVLGKEQSTLF